MSNLEVLSFVVMDLAVTAMGYMAVYKASRMM